MEQEIIIKQCHPDGMYSVMIEDDGRVAYAYLRARRKIVGDVWLYNRCATPQKAEWRDKNMIPFANPESFVKDGNFILPSSKVDFRIEWGQGSNDAIEVRVFVRDVLHAVLAVGDKPGRCRLARKDGPLAKRLPVENMEFR